MANHGAMRGTELAASRRAIAEERRRRLPILEACVERDEDGIDEYVHVEIRRLRRLLGLPPAQSIAGGGGTASAAGRDRVRRFRERRAMTDAL